MKRLLSYVLILVLIFSTPISAMPSKAYTLNKKVHVQSTNNSKDREISPYKINQWVYGTPLPGLKDIYSSEVEYNGKIYLSVGEDKCYFYIYDIDQNTWTTSSPNSNLSHSSSYTQLIASNGKIYCIGYYLDIYDIEKDTWEDGNLNISADYGYGYLGVLSGTKLFIFNGGFPDKIGKGMIIYDIMTKEHTFASEFPSDIYTYICHRPYLYDGKIYFTTSTVEPRYEEYIICYDIATDKWTSKKIPLDLPVLGDSALCNGKIYYIGGESQEIWKPVNTVNIFDIDTNTWTRGDDLPHSISHQTCVNLGQLIYVVGGLEPYQILDSCMIYDTETNRWSAGGTLNIPRSGNQIITTDNKKIFVAGNLLDYDSPDISDQELFEALALEIYTPGPVVTDIADIQGTTVSLKTSPNALQHKLETEYPKVSANLSNGDSLDLPIVWDVAHSNYDGSTLGTYTVTGHLDLTGSPEIAIPVENEVKIHITVEKDPSKNIVSIESPTIVAQQSYYPGPTDKTHSSGSIPSIVDIPQTVTVVFEDGHKEQMPLSGAFTPELFQSIYTMGVECKVDISQHPDYLYCGGSSDDVRTWVSIEVIPANYEAWIIEPEEIEVEVLPGTSLQQISGKLWTEKKRELDVVAYNTETDLDAYLFCDFSLDEKTNPNWKNQMDTPGTYTLKGTLPDNFVPAADDIGVSVKVTVTEPLEITKVETARTNSYQSYAFADIPDLPNQVTVTLEDNSTVPVDVEWYPDSYDRDATGEQIVIGELVNLPSKVKQPAGQPFTAQLIVNTIPVDYQITEVVSDNAFTADAGLTLAEITEKVSPKLTVSIGSITSGVKASTQYEVDVILEDEKNPDFDPELADVYILKATLGLPENITYTNTDAQIFDEVFLETTPVEIVSVEPASALAKEGTTFADLELPETVSATLSNGKTVSVPVDWGDGTGYDPSPEGLADDHPVVCTVTGSIVNWPQYINGAGVSADLKITVIKTYTLDAITPSQITMDVNLGSSLEDIYNQLESHTAQLTLKSYQGDAHTTDVTFGLREEDNSSYDPMTVGTYTLTAYLPLEGNVLNPNDLKLEIVVQTKKYTISNIPAVRHTGVVSGTPFEEIGLPEKVDVLRNDGVTDKAPVTWDGSKYNPTKIGSQVVRGTLTAPLPVHLENPNNRQPNAMVTIVNPEVTILSMKQVRDRAPTTRSLLSNAAEESIPGFTEYKYEVELQHKDGTITTEIISLFTEE